MAQPVAGLATQWTANATPFDPLGTVSKVVGIQNALSLNKLYGLESTHLNIGNQQAQSDLNVGSMNRQASVVMGLLAQPDDVLSGQSGYDSIKGALDAELANNPTPSAQRAHDVMLSQVPGPLTNGTPTPAATYRKLIVGHGLQLLSPTSAFSAAIGTPCTVSTGQSVQPGMQAGPVAPNPGSFTPAGPAVQQFPSRSELAGQTTQTDTNEFMPDGTTPNPNFGRTVTIPLATRLQNQGVGPSLGGPAAGASPSMPVAPAQSGPPRLNQPSPQPSSGGVVTGMGAADQPALTASGTQYANDRAEAGSYAARIFPLNQAATLLQAKNPDGSSAVTTGPGSDFINHIKSFILARSQNLPNFDPNKLQVANYEELGKYLQQVVNSNPLASQSDAKLAATLSGSPGTHLSSLTNENVIKALVGLERMKQAAIMGYNGSPANYANYLKTFSTTSDPRAYVTDMLSPDQRTKMYNSMSPTERKQFGASFANAQKLGLLTNTGMPANTPQEKSNQ